MRRYLWNLLRLVFSHLPNTVTGGDPEDSLSRRCGRPAACHLCRWLCRLLDKIDPGHCAEEQLADECATTDR
jgi:hypothetical protein